MSTARDLSESICSRRVGFSAVMLARAKTDILYVGGSMFIAFVVGMVVGLGAMESLGLGLKMSAITLAFIYATFAGYFFHEMGHWIALRLVGRRVRYVFAGDADGPYFRLGSIGGTEFCLGLRYLGRVVPVETHQSLSPTELRVGAAGGPAATLLLALAIWLLAQAGPLSSFGNSCVSFLALGLASFPALELAAFWLPNTDTRLVIRGRWKD